MQVYTQTHTYTFAHLCTHTALYMHIHVYTCADVHLYTSACVHICTCVYTHICPHVHIYTHAHIHINIHPCVHVFHAFCSPACAPLRVASQVVLRGPWHSHSDRHKPCGLCHRLDCALRPWLPAGCDPTIGEPWGPQGSGAYGVLTGGRTGQSSPGASGPSWPF